MYSPAENIIKAYCKACVSVTIIFFTQLYLMIAKWFSPPFPFPGGGDRVIASYDCADYLVYKFEALHGNAPWLRSKAFVQMVLWM